MAGLREADVLVVGGGGAGLAAAHEAASRGASVILLEKNPATGGSTAWSLGAISATGTALQRRAGIDDNADAHFEDLALHAGALAPRDNLVLRRVLVDGTRELIDWLSGLGVVFAGPAEDPPNRVARMHNALPNSRALIHHLTRHCRRLGVDIRLGCASTRLLQDGPRVCGVQVRQPDGTLADFRARRAVVLASGDYSGASDLKQQLASPEVAAVDPVNPTATGDGHRMALAIGATVVNGDIVRGPIMRFVPRATRTWLERLPPSRPFGLAIAWALAHLPQALIRPFMMKFLTTALGPSPQLLKEGAILVNREGRRFAASGERPHAEMARQTGQVGWFVFDHRVERQFSRWPYFISTAPGVAYAYMADYRRHRPDLFHTAGDARTLARRIGVPPDALAATLAATGDTAGPCYALGPVKAYVVFTDGGLKVSERLEVLRSDGSVIAGLYAAGSAGQGGLLLEGHGHHLAWAFISGRIAGRHAAGAT